MFSVLYVNKSRVVVGDELNYRFSADCLIIYYNDSRYEIIFVEHGEYDKTN